MVSARLPVLATGGFGHQHPAQHSSSPVRSSSPPMTPSSQYASRHYAHIHSSPLPRTDLGFFKQSTSKNVVPLYLGYENMWKPLKPHSTWLSNLPVEDDLPSLDDCDASGSPVGVCPPLFSSEFVRGASQPVQGSAMPSDDEDAAQDEKDDISILDGWCRTTFFQTSAERGRWRYDPEPFRYKSPSRARHSVPLPTSQRDSHILVAPRKASEPLPSTSQPVSSSIPPCPDSDLTGNNGGSGDCTEVVSNHADVDSFASPLLSNKGLSEDDIYLPSSPLPPSSLPSSPISRSMSPMSLASEEASSLFAPSSPVPSALSLEHTVVEDVTRHLAPLNSPLPRKRSFRIQDICETSEGVCAPPPPLPPVGVSFPDHFKPLRSDQMSDTDVTSTTMNGFEACHKEFADVMCGQVCAPAHEVGSQTLTTAMGTTSIPSTSSPPADILGDNSGITKLSSVGLPRDNSSICSLTPVHDFLDHVEGRARTACHCEPGPSVGHSTLQDKKGKALASEDKVLQIKDRNGVTHQREPLVESSSKATLPAKKRKASPQLLSASAPPRKKMSGVSTNEDKRERYIPVEANNVQNDQTADKPRRNRGKRRPADDENHNSHSTESGQQKVTKQQKRKESNHSGKKQVSQEPMRQELLNVTSLKAQEINEPVETPSSRAPAKAEPASIDAEMCGLLIETMALSRATSLPLSSICKTIMQSRPALKSERTEEEWMRLFGRILARGEAGSGSGVFGKVDSSGKDDSGRPLEAQWFYVPEKDEDQDRAALIRLMMPRSGKRSETKKYKQYYWRPLAKISRWDPEDEL